MALKATLKLVKETKGALRYEEVNAAGALLDMADAVIGTLYLRKTNFVGSVFPTAINVTVVPAGADADEIAL